MSFEIRKNTKRWLIAGTGSGWELMPRNTEQIVFVLNDFIYTEKYGVIPDYLCIMDVLDSKPQIVEGINDLGNVIERINKMKVPLIAPYKYEEIPLSESFPLKKAHEEFGLAYYSNTICYMIAYALLNGAKEIDTYGVNQAGSHEYNLEKAAVEYWLGICNGRGVKITIHGDKSNLLSNREMYGGDLLYGYNMDYEAIMRSEEQLGQPIIKRLMTPQKAVSRRVREVN